MTSTQMRADRDALSVADVLDRAADLITPEGAWTQGTYWNGEGCFCALGAVSMAAIGDVRAEWSTKEMLLASRAASRILNVGESPIDLSYVADWNDDPGQTQEKVVAKLREAAALAREQGL